MLQIIYASLWEQGGCNTYITKKKKININQLCNKSNSGEVNLELVSRVKDALEVS